MATSRKFQKKVLQIIELFSVYFMGYLNFSLAWIFLFKISQFFLLTNFKYKNENIIENEKSKIKNFKNNGETCESCHLPSWVRIPDTQRAEWINTIFSTLWKWEYTIDTIKKIIIEKVASKIVNKFPGGAFKLENIDLGNFAPRISGIKVYENDVENDSPLHSSGLKMEK